MDFFTGLPKARSNMSYLELSKYADEVTRKYVNMKLDLTEIGLTQEIIVELATNTTLHNCINPTSIGNLAYIYIHTDDKNKLKDEKSIRCCKI
jgi:hypothetical protein